MFISARGGYSFIYLFILACHVCLSLYMWAGNLKIYLRDVGECHGKARVAGKKCN